MLLPQYKVGFVTYALSIGFGTQTRRVSMLYTRLFHAFFIRMEYDCFLMDPSATRVYQYPHLIAVDRLLLSCSLAYPAPQSHFNRSLLEFHC